MNQTKPPRNPWPIVIIAYFVVFISGLVVFTAFASRQRVDLVRRDYYEEEIRYQQQLDRIKRTRPLAAGVVITYNPTQQAITISLPLAHALAHASGQIHLYRPSDARLDQDLQLALDPNGDQRVDARNLKTGLWNVRVQWQVDGLEYSADQRVVISAANS